MIPIGFFLLTVQGISELIKKSRHHPGAHPRSGTGRTRADRRGGIGREIAAQREKQAPGQTQRRPAMTQLIIHNMAPLMFVGLFIFLLLGYPVAFALAANGIPFGLIGIELGLLQPTLFGALPERIWGVMSNDTLLAVPFFTLMACSRTQRHGRGSFDTIGQLFGPIRGGPAFAVIFVGALLAATTGVVAASVIS